jgi:methionyl-tRNA formyltransferase
MKHPKSYSCIFFGKKDDKYSTIAINFLKKNFFKVEAVLTKNIIGEKINQKYFINFKKYDYLFAYKTKIIIPEKVLNKVKLYSINFHNSLNKYPGSGGNFMSLINNDKFTGITVHLINKNVDNGKIFYLKKVRIKKNDNIKIILDRLELTKLEVFKLVIKNLKNQLWLSKKIIKSNYLWNKKTYKIKEINKLREFKIELNKKKNDILKI